ncbi:MAG: hypothetical protein JSV65_12060 [Armatimonadota bacterium]|nr:MAG: hypothetical protein JSV65_12060 [Armatimonadota bacterium]
MKSVKLSRRLKWIVVWTLAAAALMAGGLLLTAAAEPGGPQQVARIEPTPLPEVVRKPIAVEDPLTALLHRATVLAPHSHGNLTVFPVAASHIGDFGSVLTMDEALTRGLLVIQEVGGGSVNQVLAVNRSDRYVFLMASEMIGGAKQDRTVAEDVLLAPRSKAQVPVFCVEAHRWTAAAPDARFRVMEFNAPMTVRRTARLKQDQSAVWAEVAREQERLEAPSATGAIRSVYESRHVQQKLAPYVSVLSDVPSAAPNVIGVVIARGDRIICADLFYRPDLFRRLWPRLLRSYAADVVGKPGGSRRATVGDAERFLGRLYHAERTIIETPGAGRAIRLHRAGVNGSALIHGRSVVHLEVFPGIELLRPGEPVRPMDLDLRRQRLEE